MVEFIAMSTSIPLDVGVTYVAVTSLLQFLVFACRTQYGKAKDIQIQLLHSDGHMANARLWSNHSPITHWGQPCH